MWLVPPHVEILRDANHPDGIVVLDKEPTSLIERNGKMPPQLLRLAQTLALPTKPTPFGSVGVLFGEMRDVLQGLVELSEESVQLLVHFSIASWFPDCVPVAPLLVLSGTAVDVHPLLSVLRSFCRHGLLVTDLTPAAISSPGMQLCPTLLVSQGRVNARLGQLLLTSSLRGFQILNRVPRTIYCAKMIHVEEEDSLPEEFVSSAVWIAVPPATRVPRLESTWPKVEQQFQNKLLAYRMAVKDKVTASDFDLPNFATGLRTQARTLGCCIIGDPQLQSRLAELLQPQSAEDRISRGTDVKCVVIEALLVCIHEGKADKVRVREITEQVNKLLQCRGEVKALKPEEVGWKLKQLGLPTRKVGSAGKGLEFDQATRQLVHGLAKTPGVVGAGWWFGRLPGLPVDGKRHDLRRLRRSCRLWSFLFNFLNGGIEMKNRLGQQENLEQWRRRFQENGCPVDEAPPDSEDGLIIQLAERNFLDCMATVDKAAWVIRYVFRLRLISDDPNRIIREFFMESEVEDIRVLDPNERMPRRFITWGPRDEILNDRVSQRFGPVRVREGMLLGEGRRSPVVSGRGTVAPITVGVVDQFERSYSKRLFVNVDGLEKLIIKLPEPPKVRIGGGAFEPLDEDEQETSAEG